MTEKMYDGQKTTKETKLTKKREKSDAELEQRDI